MLGDMPTFLKMETARGLTIYPSKQAAFLPAPTYREPSPFQGQNHTI